MITVVSRRTTGQAPPGENRVYIGRPSLLGNPFVIGRDGTREEVIRKFETEVILSEEAKRLLHALTAMHEDGFDIELECWCAPLPCHGDVIKKWIEEGAFADVDCIACSN